MRVSVSTGTVTPAVVANNKVYDGNTTATISNAGTLNGVVEKDTVMVSNSGATFDNRNAGTAKTVTLNGVVLSGTDAGNYSIANTATDTADITKRGGVVLTALNKEKQLGAADPALTFEVTGLVQGDSLTGSLSRVAGETPGFYAINRGTVDNPNYEISQFNAGQLQINQSLPHETFATRFVGREKQVEPLITAFGGPAVRDWAQGLGVDGGKYGTWHDNLRKMRARWACYNPPTRDRRLQM